MTYSVPFESLETARTAADISDALFYFTATNSSGDSYRGYVLADVGTYQVGTTYSTGLRDEDNGLWYYHIDSSTSLAYDTELEGHSVADTNFGYYDAETGLHYDFFNTAGQSGVGSETGRLDTPGQEKFGDRGRFEADPPKLTTFYSYIAKNTSGDYYYGYVFDQTGKYAIGSSYPSGFVDNDGGRWSYEVYDAVDYGYDTGFNGASGVNNGYRYYDAETETFQSSNTVDGTNGMGSESGSFKTGTRESFGNLGRYEADQTPRDAAYYFIAVNSSGDHYHGVTYADTGVYEVGRSYSAAYNDNDGGMWTYTIYERFVYNFETNVDKLSIINTNYDYYDGESGTYHSVTGFRSYGGIGSELGKIDSTGQLFGYYGKYEADEITDTEYYFLAVNSGGDFYYGYAFADKGAYKFGSTYYSNFVDSDGGLWSYYVYGGYDYAGESGYEGTSFVNGQYYYYDAESDSNQSYSAAAGSNGLGSEYGFLDFSGEAFGYQGLYEADISGDSIYYFLAVNTSDDFYYGITYAETGTYTVGATYNANFNDNDGGLWTYRVYDSDDLGYETGQAGASLVNGQYYYYDSAADSNLTYTAVTGHAGIGSEYGQLTGGTQDYFGYQGLYEADLL